jgi:hypothetical protein
MRLQRCSNDTKVVGRNADGAVNGGLCGALHALLHPYPRNSAETHTATGIVSLGCQVQPCHAGNSQVILWSFSCQQGVATAAAAALTACTTPAC